MYWDNDDIIELMELDAPPYEQRVHTVRARQAAHDFTDFIKSSGRVLSEIEKGGLEKNLAGFLAFRCADLVKDIRTLVSQLDEYNLRYMRAASDREREDHVLAFARILGANDEQLTEDRKAFSRWFGFDAVRERCLRMIAGHEYTIHYNLSRLGSIAARALAMQDISQVQQDIWDSLNLGKFLVDFLSYDGDSRIRVEAFRSLAKTIKVLRPDVQNDRIDAHTIIYVYRFAIDKSQDVWPQCEALSLLEELSLEDLAKAIIHRFEEPGESGDIFVRRRSATLAGKHAHASPKFNKALSLCMKDPSPFVRIGLAQSMPVGGTSKGVDVLRQLALKDEVYQVRAAASFELSRFVIESSVNAISAIWIEILTHENHSFVLRTTLEAVCLTLSENPASKSIIETVLPCVLDLHVSAPDHAVRRYAAQARERLVLLQDETCAELVRQLAELVVNIPPGKSGRVPTKLVKEREEIFGRTLSLLAQRDFGFSVRKGFRGYRIYRGAGFEFQYWRMTHELFNPSPDKRQAFRHTIGRKVRGDMLVPSAILSELTQTKVPGEPLHFSKEAGWRPYLPLPGEALASLGHSILCKSMRTYTAEGVTILTPPRSPFKRLWAAWKLMFGFAKYAELRNWSEKSGHPPTEYSEALQKLGFSMELKEYTAPGPRGNTDDSVQRFFPLALPFMDSEWWLGVREYFFSAYGNSLYELGLFSTLLLGGFALHRAYLHHRAIRSRKKIPLVVGGWGTRGKSGVERLKAAVLEGRGHSMVSKTTGCEALFLHSYPFGKTQEMFLFRPYDKATIWEHHSLMDRAVNLGAEVYLWECMGLTPSYVRILQRRWSRDDYSTITNTYPDHEDIQGPAGINIPEVMTNFIPENGVLVTSEEEMTPIIEEAAGKLKTDVRRVSWLDAGLLTDDVLERFPYSEHPSNIALVMELADELGIDRDYALKEMADRVIPDIGVLKAFPVAQVNNRRLQFVNGMSANERFATLANWRRMGFADTNLDNDPDIFITTVVNNRADRLSRSRMFASIVVEDLPSDRHVLIGTNLGGLMGYIKKALEHFLKGVTLLSDDDRMPEDILTANTRQMRIPTSQEQMRNRLEGILTGLNIDAPIPLDVDPADGAAVTKWVGEHCPKETGKHVAAHMQEMISGFNTYNGLLDEIAQAGGKPTAEMDEHFRSQLREWFLAKIIVIEDIHASGEEIINTIAQATPPGMLNRIMGLQNIKGTGLDFVYRWQTWEACHAICEGIRHGSEKEKRTNLERLLSFREYGLLSEEAVLETIEVGRKDTSLQAERLQAALSFAQSSLANSMSEIRLTLGKKNKRGLAMRTLDALESFLDAGDAVRRRKMAHAIYEDLENQRISHDRAAVELKALNKQQKGGWLHDRFFVPLSKKIDNQS